MRHIQKTLEKPEWSIMNGTIQGQGQHWAQDTEQRQTKQKQTNKQKHRMTNTELA